MWQCISSLCALCWQKGASPSLTVWLGSSVVLSNVCQLNQWHRQLALKANIGQDWSFFSLDYPSLIAWLCNTLLQETKQMFRPDMSCFLPWFLCLFVKGPMGPKGDRGDPGLPGVAIKVRDMDRNLMTEHRLKSLFLSCSWCWNASCSLSTFHFTSQGEKGEPGAVIGPDGNAIYYSGSGGQKVNTVAVLYMLDNILLTQTPHHLASVFRFVNNYIIMPSLSCPEQ